MINFTLARRSAGLLRLCPALTLLVLFASSGKVNAQINAYAQVTAISGSTLTIANVNQSHHTYAVGEQVIIIQMQDTAIGSIVQGNNALFGYPGTFANAGAYEIRTITAINPNTSSPTSLVLNAAPSWHYNLTATGKVQVVSFSIITAGNYTTAFSIAGVPWNGTIGGVVAFQVGGTLTLNYNVTADGIGYRGGATSSNYEVTCEPNVYDTTSSNYGYKGEGIHGTSTLNYTNQTGRAPLANGGGGGSDDNGGGGGGANYTSGGQAGPGWTCSTATPAGGFGGYAMTGYPPGNRVFMGGGGGGGQQNNTAATAGGAGGGIIMIKANQLNTNCSSGGVTISANGVTGNRSGNDGAGGGGAAGSIIIQVNSYGISNSCPLTVQANGGNGGYVNYAALHSGGGGGGQGTIMFANALPTTNVTATTLNGSGGANSTLSPTTYAGNGGGTNNSGIFSGVGTVLPVNFLSFNASKNGSQSALYWVTSKTYQAVSFNIQRSVNGGNFAIIGNINAVIDASSEETYTFIDTDPGAGSNVYRIEEIDLAGNTNYSTVAQVDFTGLQNAFSIYPNPTGGQFTIQLTQVISHPVTVRIDDLAGKTICGGTYTPSGKLIPVSPNTQLARGIYLVHVEDGTTNSQTGKLIVR